MKDYDLIIANIYQDLIKDVTSDENFLYESINKILVWLVSLSIAAIGLIVGYFDKFSNLGFSLNEVKLIIICLVASIVFGLFARLFHLRLIRKSRYSATIFKVALQPYIVRSKAHKLDGDENSRTIYNYLIEDFDIDEPYLMQLVQLKLANSESEADSLSRKHYEEIVEIDNRNYDAAVDKLNKIMNESLEINPNKKERKPIFKISRIFLSRIINTCYFITFASFIIALILFILFSVFQDRFSM